MQNLIECHDLVKSFPSCRALGGINLQIPSGRIVGLLGPNGSGKSTFIKLCNGLLSPDSGQLLICGNTPGVETKKVVSYLPERTYLNDWMNVNQMIRFFADFYEDFESARAYDMLSRLNINPAQRMKTMSKGTKEKVQLILVMSRRARLYLLDEPIGGVDPAARDFILNTIISNYNPEGSVVISTHLISDVEKILDDVVFINGGNIVLCDSVDNIRAQQDKSVAQELGVNVNTVQKAYRMLEKDGVIVSYPGKGSFIASGDNALLRQQKSAREALRTAAQNAADCGLSEEEIVECAREGAQRRKSGQTL